MTIGAFPIGSAALGGGIHRVLSLVPQEVKLTIDGVDYTQNLMLDSLLIEEELNGRGTCSFALEDVTKSLHLKIGEVVRITYRGTIKFAGTVDEVTENVPGDVAEVMIHEVKAVDWNQLCDRHYVANKWQAGESIYTVVTQIANTYSDLNGGTETLVGEGVTANSSTVETDPKLEAVVFNYQTVSEAFDDLAELTGFFWKIDYNKVLYFVPRSKFFAPFPLDDNQWLQYRGCVVKRSRQDYRNIQYLRAGQDETAIDANVETFLGDGEKTTFTLKMPVSRAPKVEVKLGAGSYVEKTVGILKKDEGKDWYYQIDDKEISQDTDGTKLTSIDRLRVTYTGFFPIILDIRNQDEIDSRKLIEGGTGVYIDVEEDGDIDDAGLAADKVVALLRKFGRIQNEIEFETDVDGFVAGQLLSVNLPDHGLAGDYLIESVRFGLVGENLFRYRIRAIDGEALGGWSEFYKKLAKKGRPLTIRENEKLLLLRQSRSQIELSDVCVTTEPHADYDLDGSSHFILGVSRIGGRRYPDISTSQETGVFYGPQVGRPKVVP